jgi:transposase
MGVTKLTDQEWDVIKDEFPSQHMGRPRRWSERDCLDGVLYVLKTGSRWKDLPSNQYPPKSTVYDRFCFWVERGILQKILAKLRKRFSLGKVFYIDSTLKSAKKGQVYQSSRKNQRH